MGLIEELLPFLLQKFLFWKVAPIRDAQIFLYGFPSNRAVFAGCRHKFHQLRLMERIDRGLYLRERNA
jgi:hypothetical protein